MLANQFVGCRQIQDDISTGHRQVVAGRNGCPNVLTNLNAQPHSVTGMNDNGLGRDFDGRTSQIDGGRIQVTSGRKPTLLIEFAIVGQISLGDYGQYATLLDGNSAVEQQ